MTNIEDLFAQEQASLAAKKKLIDTKRAVDELVKKHGYESLEDFDAKLNAAFVTVPKPSKPKLTPRFDDITKRREYVKQALAEKKTIKSVADYCGVVVGTINSDKKALGLVKPDKKPDAK